MKKVSIQLRGVNKYYGNNHIVRNLDLDVYNGEFLTLLGPSGCGKTTTLRMIAGFEDPTDGTILLNGKSVVGVPPYKRDVNTVFQNYALFPHLNVKENIAYGLQRKGLAKLEVESKVNEALRMVQMEAFATRKPREMSGGQQQRVAVARSVINNPSVLLLDEPLGALDLKLRKQMQVELKHLQQKLGITFIYVTHDQEEALTMSDRIAVMNNGRIEQMDDPETIYHFPRTKFVADFIGETNIVHGKVVDLRGNDLSLQLGSIIIQQKRSGNDIQIGETVEFSIRPEKLALSQDVTLNSTRVQIEEYIFVGNIFKAIVKLENDETLTVNVDVEKRHQFPEGSTMYMTLKEQPVLLHT